MDKENARDILARLGEIYIIQKGDVASANDLAAVTAHIYEGENWLLKTRIFTALGLLLILGGFALVGLVFWLHILGVWWVLLSIALVLLGLFFYMTSWRRIYYLKHYHATSIRLGRVMQKISGEAVHVEQCHAREDFAALANIYKFWKVGVFRALGL